jgi:integrase
MEPMTFTAARIDRVKIEPGQRRTFADGSLCLTVGTRTRRWWTYGRDGAGAQREVTLGQWPALPIREARARATQVRDGLKGAPCPDIQLQDAFAAYAAQRDYSDATQAAYQTYANNAEALLGDKRLRQVTDADLRRIWQHHADADTVKAGSETIRHLLRVWHHFADDIGRRAADAPHMPASKRRAPAPTDVPRFRTRADFRTYIERVKAWSGDLSALLQAQAYTGYRISMLRKLAWADVNLAQRYWTIRHATKGQSLELPIPAPVVAILQSINDRRGLVWDTPRDYRAIFHAVSKALGYKVRSHSVRRFFIGECASAGIDPNMARLIVGHASGGDDIHAGTYLRDVIVDQLREPAEDAAAQVLRVIRGDI